MRATIPAGDLVFKIREHLAAPTEFKELKVPLENQLPAIVASVEAGLVELAQRRRLQAIEAERQAVAARAHRKRAAYGEAQAALRERLNGQAARFQQAQAIRAYIVAADDAPIGQGEDYPEWRAWALAEADALDPLRDGSAPFARLPPLEEWAWRGW